MNRDDLKLLLDKTPFAPFCLALSTSETFEVRHPELAFLEERFIAVGQPVKSGDESRILIHWISYQHIAHIHRLPL
jgi:hypothetical protein